MGANFLNTPEPIITLTTKKVAVLTPILGFNTSILQFKEFYRNYIISNSKLAIVLKHQNQAGY